MADPKSPKAPENDAPKAEAVAEVVKEPEPRNLTRECLALELGEEEARRRIP